MAGIGHTIDRILELQPAYASSKTAAMEERGRLVRTVLTQQVAGLRPRLSAALAEFGDDFSVGGSDGIGRKTEAPWVRFHSARMAPTPRDGYYTVIHFSADGSAFWVTVGCGSTQWLNGDLKKLPPPELARRTAWARAVVLDQFGTLTPFDDQIALGAKAALPKTFELATAMAQRFDPGASDADIEDALFVSAERLREIYRAQRIGGDLNQADAMAREVEGLVRPARSGGQAFGLSGPERAAVEARGMALAAEWLRDHGYSFKDVSKNSSFDLLAKKDGLEIKIEVKGTTSANCDAIFMTRNEVKLHASEQGRTGLLLVPGIKLHRNGDQIVAKGGACEALMGWDISDWSSEPISFRLTRKPRDARLAPHPP